MPEREKDDAGAAGRKAEHYGQSGIEIGNRKKYAGFVCYAGTL